MFLKDLEDAVRAMQKLETELPKSIKVTTAFALYLKQTTPPLPEKPDGFINGMIGHYDGIPLIIDDEIEGFYKVEY